MLADANDRAEIIHEDSNRCRTVRRSVREAEVHANELVLTTPS